MRAFRLVPVVIALLALAACTSSPSSPPATGTTSATTTPNLAPTSGSAVCLNNQGQATPGSCPSPTSVLDLPPMSVAVTVDPCVGVDNNPTSNPAPTCAAGAASPTPSVSYDANGMPITCIVAWPRADGTTDWESTIKCTRVPQDRTKCAIRPDNLITLPGYPVPVRQPVVGCGEPYTAQVDFRYLGDQPDCALRLDPQVGRPCWLPIHTQPSLASAPVADWQPVEGQDVLSVSCQVEGNNVFGEGTERDVRNWYSAVWSRVTSFDGQTGYANDLWLGNTGWHGIPCSN